MLRLLRATALSGSGFEHGLNVQLNGDLVADDDLLTFASIGANAVVRSSAGSSVIVT
jgi:hypothetical protein